MRLLITGSHGFTGRHLTQAACAAKYEVIELAGDLCDRDSIFAQIAEKKPSHVIHLAGISQVTGADELAYYNVNVLGSLNVLTALATLNPPPQKVILASSANVYGNNAHSPITESELPAPISHYAASKLTMEYLSRNFSERLPIVIARPFNYTGVGHAEHFVVPKIVSHFKRKAKTIELGNIHVLREYNDVRDICQMYLKLLVCGQRDCTYNLATGQEHSLKEIIATLEVISGHTLTININPSFVRANEITRLCGDASALSRCIGPIALHSLEDTLAWMLTS